MISFDWDAELSGEQRDGLIEKFAQRVVRYQLATPALLFLEMHRPVAFLVGQSLLLGSGFLAPLFGPQNVQQMAKLLEKRENIARLLERIEALEEEKGQGKREKGKEEDSRAEAPSSAESLLRQQERGGVNHGQVRPE